MILYLDPAFGAAVIVLAPVLVILVKLLGRQAPARSRPRRYARAGAVAGGRQRDLGMLPPGQGARRSKKYVNVPTRNRPA